MNRSRFLLRAAAIGALALVALYRLHTSGLGRIYGIAARPDFLAAIAAMLGQSLRCGLLGLNPGGSIVRPLSIIMWPAE